jgi:hypothetical protein
MVWRAVCALFVSAGAAGISVSSAAAEELVYVPNSTKRICQLTGDVDRASGLPTPSRTGTRFGVTATDLGSSFEHRGKRYFLFGDTWGRPGDRDALAWTSSTRPDRIQLNMHKAGDGKWLPLRVPGIEHGAFEIPSAGISTGGVIYVVFTTDHSPAKVMGRSVLAASHDDGLTFKMLYELSRTKFINASFWQTDNWLYIYGSGDYRKSSVCLARVKPADIGERSKLRYFVGVGEDGRPRWSSKEAEAVVLFRQDQIGEFSVSYLEPVKRYVMLYNASKPRGITMRSAEHPWGPWSAGTLVFEPWRDNGYGYFMHISAEFKQKKDRLSDPKREDEWGGEYGPSIMSRFTTVVDGHCRISYTMSTWNPYQVLVMRTDLDLQSEAK